jgi:hypothetical protein
MSSFNSEKPSLIFFYKNAARKEEKKQFQKKKGGRSKEVQSDHAAQLKPSS